MITAIVLYRLPASIGRSECRAHYLQIAQTFLGIAGLHHKQFIWRENGDAGGVYLWDSLAAARAFYTGPWLNGIRERYGVYPEITYFETFAMTDALRDKVEVFDA